VAKSIHMIGLDPDELEPVRLVVALLRHPDPSVGDLVWQALIYLQEVAARRGEPAAEARQGSGSGRYLPRLEGLVSPGPGT
jgi:hypothetical protein